MLKIKYFTAHNFKEINMKNTLIAFTIVMASPASFANSPLLIQHTQPAPLDVTVQTSKTQSPYSLLENLSVNGGYTGGMIDEPSVKLRFKGLELGATYFLNETDGIFTKYEQQKDELKLKEFSVSGIRNFYNKNNVYMNGMAGIGYAWVDGSSEGYSVDLEYLTIPVGVEVGQKFTPHLALYGGLGYKWLYNQNAKACVEDQCIDAGKRSGLDTHGTTYRFGLRYDF